VEHNIGGEFLAKRGRRGEVPSKNYALINREVLDEDLTGESALSLEANSCTLSRVNSSPSDGWPAKNCVSGDTKYRQRVFTLNDEDGNARRGEEPWEQVKICGSLGDVNLREDHIDAVEV